MDQCFLVAGEQIAGLALVHGVQCVSSNLSSATCTDTNELVKFSTVSSWLCCSFQKKQIVLDISCNVTCPLKSFGNLYKKRGFALNCVHEKQISLF